MTAPLDLDDPIAVLLAVVDALGRARLEGAVYGGLALAAYGEPRETKDADIASASLRAADGVDALRAIGLDATMTFENVTFGGNVLSRVTLLPNEGSSGLNTVDFVQPRSLRYAREALARSIEGTLRCRALRVLAPEDFVLFKVLSTRERDLEDAASILRALADRIDEPLVEREAALLAREISDHDVAGRLAAVRALVRSGIPR